jgi:uncharacterized membrane protein
MKHITSRLSLLTVPVILYLAGAFYAVTFNVAYWPETTREIVATMGAIGTVVHYILRGITADIHKG